jgi:hypothetical protein
MPWLELLGPLAANPYFSAGLGNLIFFFGFAYFFNQNTFCGFGLSFICSYLQISKCNCCLVIYDQME